MVKNLPANARDVSSVPGSGRAHGGGNSPCSSILAWKSHRQRSNSIWGHKRVGRDLVTAHIIESASNRCLPNKLCDYMDVSLLDLIAYYVIYAMLSLAEAE